MRIVHIFKSTNSHFFKPFIDVIEKNFDISNHSFCIITNKKEVSSDFQNNRVRYIENNEYIRLLKELIISDKVILHGLMSPKINLILFLMPRINRKSYWVIWGSDLYYHERRKKNVKTNVNEYLRKSIIKRFKGMITHTKGDYELAKKWYGAKGQYLECIMYPSNVYKKKELQDLNSNKKIVIQIGNSADPSNNHEEIFSILEKLSISNFEIICPLSYGNKAYANEIKEIGEKKFGSNFIALMDFISIEQYLEIQSKITIAFFNHKRQQAMGNIITLIGMGKTVYLREDIVTWQLFQEKGIKLKKINELKDLEVITETDKNNNIRIIEDYFSNENLISQLNNIFDEETEI